MICFTSSQSSGKHLLAFISLLKGVVKDTDEQPDEEVCKTKSGRVLSTGASGPLKLGCITHLPGMDVFC